MVLRINFPEKKEKEKKEKFDRGRVYIEIKLKYENLRQADFPESRIVDKNWSTNAEIPHHGMSIEQNGDWNYHKSPIVKHNILDYKIFPKYRISLNCVANGNLFLALDEYFSLGKINGKVVRSNPVNGYYKTPRRGDDNMWLIRSDPVTLYFMEEADNQLIEDIKEITKPYRNPIKTPETDKVFAQGQLKDAEWMSYSKESQPEDLVKLMKRAENLNPDLAREIHMYAKADGISVINEKGKIKSLVEGDVYTRLFRISAGQYYAINEYVDEYERTHSRLRIGRGLNIDR